MQHHFLIKIKETTSVILMLSYLQQNTSIFRKLTWYTSLGKCQFYNTGPTFEKRKKKIGEHFFAISSRNQMSKMIRYICRVNVARPTEIAVTLSCGAVLTKHKEQ